MKIFRYREGNGAIFYAAEHADGTLRKICGDVYSSYVVSEELARVSVLLAPVQPVQILCIGLNYRQHAAESKMPLPETPVVFMKAISSVERSGGAILIPSHHASDQVDYECELAVVIGRTCRNVSRRDALGYVLGYTCANDVSARDWQLRWGGGQWCRGKSFDSFSPLGPCLVTADEIPNPNELRIGTRLNGEAVQDSSTGDMIFDVPKLIEFLSGSTTLPAGTVIFTGTPQGVGMAASPPRWLEVGDEIVVEIEKIGRLVNSVEREPLG